MLQCTIGCGVADASSSQQEVQKMPPTQHQPSTAASTSAPPSHANVPKPSMAAPKPTDFINRDAFASSSGQPAVFTNSAAASGSGQQHSSQQQQHSAALHTGVQSMPDSTHQPLPNTSSSHSSSSQNNKLPRNSSHGASAASSQPAVAMNTMLASSADAQSTDACSVQGLTLQIKQMKGQMIQFASLLDNPEWKQQQADGGKAVSCS